MAPERSEKNTATTPAITSIKTCMNERLTYESLIAAKLEQLAPLPALADDIWARISADLDREMPTDEPEGPSGGGPSLPGTGGMLWPGLGALLLAVAGLLYWNSQRPGLPVPARAPQPVPADSRPASIAPADTGPPKGAYQQPPSDVRPTVALPVSPSDSVDAPATGQPAVPALQPPDDARPQPAASASQELPAAPPPATAADKVAPPPAIDTPIKKKPRGVTGISNSDYRIVPDKKDSSRKKN